MTARRTNKPPVIDGVFSPREWSAAIPVHVDAIKPDMAPGLVPWQGLPSALNPPDNQDDSSFTVRAMYDDTYLYVAVDVADDIIKTDYPDVPGAIAWLDDVVEMFIDGDKGTLGNPLLQLDTTASSQLVQFSGPALDWSSAAGMRPRGYLVETKISLAGIEEAVGLAALGPGSQIGFNVTAGDDDTGLIGDPWFIGDPYLDDSYFHVPNPDVPGNPPFDPNNYFKNTPSSFLAWDGSSENWFVFDETAWGTLYFAP